MADTVVIAENNAESSGYRFSWGLALAGGVAATATIFFLLTLGSGFGLLLANPLAHNGASLPGFLTGGAIYFFAAQAFGFAVGGYLSGRLLGPIVETRVQEDFRAAAHGLVAWAVTVAASAILVALVGMSAGAAGSGMAALYGAQSAQRDSASPTAYLVDRLFWTVGNETQAMTAPQSAMSVSAAPVMQTAPAMQAPPAMQVAPVPSVSADQSALDRAEAGRILMAAAPKLQVSGDDRARLQVLVARNARIGYGDAVTRIDHITAEARDKAAQAADAARKAASYVSLWVALALLFGALVSMAAAISARLEDDRETLGTRRFS